MKPLSLEEVANGIRDASRMGDPVDSPEGQRYIQISDTLAKRLEASVRAGMSKISQLKDELFRGLCPTCDLGLEFSKCTCTEEKGK